MVVVVEGEAQDVEGNLGRGGGSGGDERRQRASGGERRVAATGWPRLESGDERGGARLTKRATSWPLARALLCTRPRRPRVRARPRVELAALWAPSQVAPKADEGGVVRFSLVRDVGEARAAPKSVVMYGVRAGRRGHGVVPRLLPRPTPTALGVERASKTPSNRLAPDVRAPLAGDDHVAARDARGPLP